MTFDYNHRPDAGIPTKRETAFYIIMFAATLIAAAGIIYDIENKPAIWDTDMALAVATR